MGQYIIQVVVETWLDTFGFDLEASLPFEELVISNGWLELAILEDTRGQPLSFFDALLAHAFGEAIRVGFEHLIDLIAGSLLEITAFAPQQPYLLGPDEFIDERHIINEVGQGGLTLALERQEKVLLLIITRGLTESLRGAEE